MNLLQRYVLRELLGPFVLSLLFFSLLMMLRQLFQSAELLLEARVGLAVFLEFMAIIVVTLVIVTVPMAALLGCLLGIGRLTADNEILAMRVAGVSLWKVFAPLFLVAALASGGLMWVGFDVLPQMVRSLIERQSEISFQIVTELEAGRPYEIETEDSELSLFYESRGAAEPGDGPYVLRMKQVALRSRGLGQDVTGANLGGGSEVAWDGPNRLVKDRETLFFADEGRIVGDIESRRVDLILEDGVALPVSFTEVFDADGERIDQFREDPGQQTELSFQRLAVEFPIRRVDEIASRLDPRQMTFFELREYLETPPTIPMYEQSARRRLEGDWREFLTVRNEYYQRLTLPWSLLAFVLISVPLAVELRPRAKTVAFLMALGLLVLYYVMLTAAGAVGMTYSPYTLAAYLAPNLVLGGIGLLLFWRVQR